jgi:hypothetical protein
MSIFQPAAHIARLPEAKIDPTYRRLRLQIFLGIFFGYAAYYLVRKNFALAMPYLIEQGFSWRFGVRTFRALYCVWIFKIHHGLSFGSFKSAFFPARRLDSGRSGDAIHGLCAVGDIKHCCYVYIAIHLRMVSRDGVASLRTHNGALVVKERTWWDCVNLELCT